MLMYRGNLEKAALPHTIRHVAGRLFVRLAIKAYQAVDQMCNKRQAAYHKTCCGAAVCASGD